MNFKNIMKSIGIIVTISFCILLVYLFIEEITHTRSTTQSELLELESFYKYLDTSSQLESVQSWYLNNEIQFYINSNFLSSSSHKAEYVLDNSEVIFHSIITNFFNEYGNRKKSNLYEISFMKSSYDIPISDFFFVRYEVEYEDIETYETFYIKKEDEIYKIYRYYITILDHDK